MPVLRPCTLQRLLANAGIAALTASILISPPAAHAGLLRPMLQWLRPQLETRLADLCLETVAGPNPRLQPLLVDPCRKLAGPTSRCLLEEADTSGLGFAVLGEIIGGRLGNAGEVVVKRCLARMFGLPVDSLRQIPLQELGRRFAPAQPAAGPARP
jgi:hypothetical protein